MRALAIAAIWTVLLAVPAITAATAAVVVPEAAAPPEARRTLAEIRGAFDTADHALLAALVHADGVRVAMSPQPERSSELTAAQAHYYFKTLFRSGRTMGFDYVRESGTGDARVHAVAVWRQAEHDTGRTVPRRLLFTLGLDGTLWRITEILTLRGG